MLLSSRKRRGQSMAELALLMPVLAMALMSLVDFGMVLYAHIQVSNAAREGARAASLYRQTRYRYTTNFTNPDKCATGIDGWSVEQAASQAIVERERDNKGCPTTTGPIQSTSLGWLEPLPTPTTWTVTIDPAYTSNVMPTPGDRATLTLRYPYRLLILSNFVPALQDPVWISKSVDYEYER